MSSDHTNSCDTSINFINCPTPAFDAANPRVGFTQIEGMSRFRRITRQDTMFSYVQSQLPSFIAKEVIDVLDPMPSSLPYDTLKTAVLKRTTASDEAKLKQLLSGVEIGDRTPSQLLRHMRSLVGTSKLDDSILQQLWLNHFPPNTKAILATTADQVSLETLADTADKIHECFHNSSVNHVTNEPPSTPKLDATLATLAQGISALQLAVDNLERSRNPRRRSRSRTFGRSSSRSQPNWFCYYHRRFGDAARNCRPGCRHPKATCLPESGNRTASQ